MVVKQNTDSVVKTLLLAVTAKALYKARERLTQRVRER